LVLGPDVGCVSGKQGEGLNEHGILRNELPEVVCQTDDALECHLCGRCRPFLDGDDMGGLDSDHSFGYQSSQVLDCVFMEIAFGGLQTELVTVKAHQNLFHKRNVGFHSRSKNKDVINIDDDASCPEDRVEQGVHDSLESGGGIAEAKIHDLRDETAERGEECSTESVLWCNTNVVESPMNIKLGENHGRGKAHD